MVSPPLTKGKAADLAVIDPEEPTADIQKHLG